MTLDALREEFPHTRSQTYFNHAATGVYSRRVVAAIEADGGGVQMAPWDQPGVGRLAMVADPDGAPFYLMDPLPPEGDPDAKSDVFSVDQPERVRWSPRRRAAGPRTYTATAWRSCWPRRPGAWR